MALTGKVAVVTGGSRGIGRSVVLRLAQEGAKIVFSYLQDEDAADETFERLADMDADARAMRADVADIQSCAELVGFAVNEFDKVDILVNSAGTGSRAMLRDIVEEDILRAFAVNVKGVLAMCKEAAAHMPPGGAIINLSSGLARYPVPGMSVYSASKGAVESLTKALAQELGPSDITVNAVSPGITATDFIAPLIADEDMRQFIVARTPLGRLGEPEDIANAVAFLASDDARWITGQIIAVNGGLGP